MKYGDVERVMRTRPGVDKRPDDRDLEKKLLDAVRDVRLDSGWGEVTARVQGGRVFMIVKRIDEKL